MTDPTLVGQRPVIGERYENFFKNKDGSNCILIRIDEYRGAYPEYFNCVLVFQCDKSDRPAERAYKTISDCTCHKCGTSLGPGGYCNDGTCPYSDVLQKVPLSVIYGEEEEPYHRKEMFPLAVTTDCGRLSLEIDCSGFLMAAHHNGTLKVISERLHCAERQQVCEEIVQAYRSTNKDLNKLLAYCEAAANAGIQDCGFHCQLEEESLSEFIRKLPPSDT